MVSHVFQFIHMTSEYHTVVFFLLSSFSFYSRSNVIGIVKLRDFALITPEQYHLTVKHLMEFHTRRKSIGF